LAHALNTVGTVRWAAGDPGGEVLVTGSLRLARAAGDTEQTCRSYVPFSRNGAQWTVVVAKNVQVSQMDSKAQSSSGRGAAVVAERPVVLTA
jgi:hypothetical protein